MNTAKELQEAVDAVGTAEVFRKQVCGIVFPANFAQLERFVADRRIGSTSIVHQCGAASQALGVYKCL